VSNKQVGVTSKMVGDSLGLVLVNPMNKNARRACEMDLIAIEIDLFRSDQKAFDMLHLGRGEIDLFRNGQKAFDMLHLWRSLRR